MGDVKEWFDDGVSKDDTGDRGVAATGARAVKEGDLGLDLSPGGIDVCCPDVETSSYFLVLLSLRTLLGDWHLPLTQLPRVGRRF